MYNLINYYMNKSAKQSKKEVIANFKTKDSMNNTSKNSRTHKSLIFDIPDVVKESMKYHIAEISKYPQLTAAENAECARIMCEGTPSEARIAREKFINGNLRLALRHAYRYCKSDYFCDVYSECLVGLIYAVDSFDVTVGVPFGLWARYYMRSRLKSTLKERGGVVAGPQKTHRDKEDEQTVTPVKIYTENIDEFFDFRASDIHDGDDLFASGTGNKAFMPLSDDMSPVTQLTRKEVRQVFEDYLNTISERDATILRMYYEETGNYTSVALAVGLSDVGVAKIVARHTLVLRDLLAPYCLSA